MYDEWQQAFEGGTYVDEDVVVDGNVITAWPIAYADFALTLARKMGAFIDAREDTSTVRIIKEFKRR